MKEVLSLLLLFLSLQFVWGATKTVSPAEEFPDPKNFPMPNGYESNVRFWMRVYGEWGEDKMIIHDSRYMDIVFDVVDVPEENDLFRAISSTEVRSRLEKTKKLLMDLQNDPNARTQSKDHQEVYDLYKNITEPDKFRNAAVSIRVQQGIKERFELGLERMTVHLDEIKKVFRMEGLPEELAYLPLVESSFNNQAVSKTKAAGIWQFMPGTARLYMKVNNDVDERYDPMRATRAAAEYLKRSYTMFGSWPLSLMSYNHGQQGVMNAVNTMGTTDFMKIINGYSGRYFGFASRNFYAEYLAATKVMHDADEYFKDIQYSKPLRFDTIRLAKPIWVTTILNHSELSREDIRIYNPALQSSVLYGKRPIPAGYDLHVPTGHYANMPEFIESLRTKESISQKKTIEALAPSPSATSPSTRAESTSKTGKTKVAKKTATASVKKTYVVRKGDTLYSISRKFATSIDTLRKMNNLTHNNIFPGQRLFVAAR
jgi:membrane-bound lytic murein transglycosylase D